MDEEQVKALIDSAIGGLRSELTDSITKANQGLAASIQRDLKKALEKTSTPKDEPSEGGDQPASGERLTLKALQDQIATLNKQLADKDAAELQANKNAAISTLIASKKLTSPATVQKLFSLEYGDRIERENDNFFYKAADGTVKPLEAAFDDYLATEEGKYFLPPSGTNGAGTKPVKPASVPAGDSSKAQTNPVGYAFAEALIDQG